MTATTRHPGKVYGHSKGKAPGSKHYYRPTWTVPSWEEFCRANVAGDVLQVCCGASRVGAVRLDRHKTPSANVRGDVLYLPVQSQAFHTVCCDPPYELLYPQRVTLQREIFRVAKLRVIFKAPWIPRGRGWKLWKAVLLASHTCANVAVLSVLERIPEERDLFPRNGRKK